MMNIKSILSKLIHDPIGTAGRLLFKTVIGPLKYKKGKDYDAERYWSDRLNKYGSSLQGPGDEGYSHEKNLDAYSVAAEELLAQMQKRGVHLESAKILEIGSGNGFYSEFFLKKGILNFKSLDITDVMFETIKNNVSSIIKNNNADFSLQKIDITTQKISGQYDLVLFIDVIEHIVIKEKLAFALNNIHSIIAPDGMLFLSPMAERSHSHLFYNTVWSIEDIKPYFPGWAISPQISFLGSSLVILQRPR